MTKVFLGWVLVTIAVGCSDASPPPTLGDPTAPPTTPAATDAAAEPCSTPARGCPCTNPGERIYCGLVYRISGSHLDCSKGYVTCNDDGLYSACEGDKIFMGD